MFREVICPVSVQLLPSSVDEFEYALYFQVPQMNVNEDQSAD